LIHQITQALKRKTANQSIISFGDRIKIINKSYLRLLLIAVIISTIIAFATTNVSNAQTANFQLYGPNGNPLSSVVFQSVAPGTSQTITVTMSSSDHATVYPYWTVSNLPAGAEISGYWNGPELWNANIGRMWNTWDVVTLQWTLTVPSNNGVASNVIVNVVGSNLNPISPTPTSSPTQASVTFSLHDINGNQISSIVFQNVAPGTSKTISSTMSSPDHATVYPTWNALDLPAGATISGCWNGPEVWNANIGRMWNTWDTVTLQWTLTVPENNAYAKNVIINVRVGSSMPSTPSPTLSPTTSPTASPPSPTISPSPLPSPTPISNSANSAILWSWLILAAVAVVCILSFLILNKRKKKWRQSKEKFAELVKTSGRVELAEASKATGVKISKIKKLLSEVGVDDSATQGFFVNGDKEFVLKSTIAKLVLEMGKFSFAGFGSKLGFTENDSERIISELLSEKKVSGTFTLDGKSFVTEESLMDEIGKK
jgi:hypothetical protein